MIRFACRCSQIVEMPDDMAGLSTQCPKCGLLLDIPALSDAGAIDTDGTYRLDDRPKPKINEHLQELTTVYYPGRKLADGTEIDLRGAVQPATPPPPPSAAAPPPTPAQRPKYDPETGELIIPVDINQPSETIHYSDLPTAGRVINYSTTTTDQIQPTIVNLGVFARLFEPVNLIILGVVLLMHLSLVVLTIITSYVIIIFAAPILLAMTLVGHYAMLVEEMGTNELDELPRPLRNVHLYDDFLAPFLHMVSSLLLCYWPSLLIIIVNLIALGSGKPFPFPRTHNLHLALVLIGSLFFPAIILTISTSGDLVNLRPDRVLGTIRCIGLRYLAIVLLWILAITAATVGQALVLLNWIAMLNFGATIPLPLIAQPFIAYPLLAAGVYLLHAFGWVLGLEYRRTHAYYPWVLQHHIREAEAIQQPILHPKLSAAEEAAQQRAAQRIRSRLR